MVGKIGKTLTRMQRSKGNLRAVLSARSSTRYSAVADLCDTSTPKHLEYSMVCIHYSDHARTNGVGDILGFFRISNLPLSDRLPTYLRTGHVLSYSHEQSPTTLNDTRWSATSSSAGGLHAISNCRVCARHDMFRALNFVPNLSHFLHYTVSVLSRRQPN